METEDPPSDPDGWPLAEGAARTVTTEIRAIAESRGDDSAVFDLREIGAEPSASMRRSSRAIPTIPPPIADADAAPAPAHVDDNEPLDAAELRDAWPFLDAEERADGLRLLERDAAEDVFIALSAKDQAQLLGHWPPAMRRQWLRLLEPDDAADVIQQAEEDRRPILLDLLDAPTRKEVHALLAYEEDEAGGLMNTRYARLRPGMSVDEALSFLRRQALGRVETVYVAYVLDAGQHLLGVVSLRDLFAAGPGQHVTDVMVTDVVRVAEGTNQEALTRIFAEHDLTAIPVVDADNVMKGIVTIDDIVDVVQEAATEDIQKFGGMEALDEPYLQVRRRDMVRKRGGWLSILCVGEMLTATALGFFQGEIDHATVLALFIPLIISSGGNSGGQASTLVIRAMALGQVRVRDWWRVMRRELVTGLALGAILGIIGAIRISIWGAAGSYGSHWVLLGLTVMVSLVGVVAFGTFVGAMLPFVFRKLGVDPASASAPFVATLVDVTGLIIYFVVAKIFLTGTLL